METTTAPDLTPGYPSGGAKSPGEWRDGHTLWMDVAPRFQLSHETLRALMFRMAAGGHLESEIRQVVTARGKRSHTHFRIKANV
jgi:hypothetical protein